MHVDDSHTSPDGKLKRVTIQLPCFDPLRLTSILQNISKGRPQKYTSKTTQKNASPIALLRSIHHILLPVPCSLWPAIKWPDIFSQHSFTCSHHRMTLKLTHKGQAKGLKIKGTRIHNQTLLVKHVISSKLSKSADYSPSSKGGTNEMLQSQSLQECFLLPLAWGISFHSSRVTPSCHEPQVHLSHL